MAVGLNVPYDLIPINGIRLSATSANIYEQERDDLALFELCEEAECSAVFTKNKFCAAPVILAKKYLNKSVPRYLLINAGNANAGTGENGVKNSEQTCKTLSVLANCQQSEVLPFSTGVIGEDLPIEKIKEALPTLLSNLRDSSWLQTAQAIMTTDTIPKAISEQINIAGEKISITGIAKGSGMIKPNMATMLSYIATDAAVSKDILDTVLVNAVSKSFNRITVDGDTSTNDACVLIATSKAGNELIDSFESEGYVEFEKAIIKVCQHLAQAIIRDGEGASKFITVDVNQGKSEQECLAIAYKIAESPLVKTAFTASDPNWGRILAAVGNSGVEDLDINKISIFLDDVCIVEKGSRAESYTESEGKRVMMQDEITLSVQVNRGSYQEKIWTTDLSHEYVTINAEYRT